MTAGEPRSSVLGRIVRPADYARVLASPMRLRSVHFAVHHLEGRPLPLNRPDLRPAAPAGETTALQPAAAGDRPLDTASLSTELSTGVCTGGEDDVDDLCSAAKSGGRPPCWLGLVVPKRHARRAVTRNLVKRQIRTIAAACAAELPPGLWVVRQRAPFDPALFPSAASDALREAARTELCALFERAVRGERDRVKPRPPGEAGDAAGARRKKPAGRGGHAAPRAPTPSASVPVAPAPPAPASGDQG